MNKIIKKLAAVVSCFAILLVAGVSLTACGKKVEPTPPTPPAPTPAVTDVADKTQLVNALKNDGSIRLTGDVTLTNESLTIDKKVTLDLNGHSIKATINDGGFKNVFLIAGGELTINDAQNTGSVELTGTSDPNSGYLFTVGVKGDTSTAAVSGKLTINGGKYKDNYTPTLLFVRYGYVEVNGGKFEVDHATVGDWDETVNLLNTCDNTGDNFAAKNGFSTDFNYANDVQLVIKGGTFKGYDPSAAKTDAKVPEGYNSAKTTDEANDYDDWFTVSKNV